MKTLIMLAMSIGLFSCQEQEPKKPEPVKPPVASKPLKFEWNHEYNDWFLVESIKKHGPALLSKQPKDWKEYIKEWPTTETEIIRFWGNVLVKMAYFESKWKGSTKYKEAFKDRNGNYVYSRGLFQLSIESGLGYKCPFKKESDVHVDSKNIECAVRILNRWIDRDGVIRGKTAPSPTNKWDKGWRGGARYWAVLRGHNDYTRKALAAIKKANE